ncbi:MAG TPA: hypothetical protein VK708_15570, partial [Bryobacteraceae bacterium]|nr:hypothetical protein [Bryobacteraceae bacterium]
GDRDRPVGSIAEIEIREETKLTTPFGGTLAALPPVERRVETMRQREWPGNRKTALFFVAAQNRQPRLVTAAAGNANPGMRVT